MSALLLFLAGRADFHKTVETVCQSKRAAECVRACVSAAFVSWKHIPGPLGKQRSDRGIRNLPWLWLMRVWSMQGGKAPVIALEGTPVPVQGTEAMKLPLHPSLQEGEYIESVISLSQVFLFFFFFILHAFFFSLLPSPYGIWAISSSSAFHFFWKRFQAETNFGVNRQDFERGAIHSSLLSTHRRKGPDSQQLGSDVCWGLFASKTHSIMCRTALGARSGTQVSSVTHCNIRFLFTCSPPGPLSPGSLSIHCASTDGFGSFCKRGGAQSHPIVWWLCSPRK